MAHLAVFFTNDPFYPVHVKKDVGLFPKYLKRAWFEKAEIIKIGDGKTAEADYGCPEISFYNLFSFPRLYAANWKTTALFEYRCIIKSFIYICRHRNITHIMLFHNSRYSRYFSLLVKTFFPKLKIYVKLDTSTDGVSKFPQFGTPVSFKQKIQKRMFESMDMISVETSLPCRMLKGNPLFLRLNVQLIPNGLDNDLHQSRTAVRKKTKTIITAGRLGSYQKNTELLLRVVAQLNLKDWQVRLIGPAEKIEQDFQTAADSFFTQYPGLRERVVFTGNITDAGQLAQEYEKAAVFVFPSRYESFGLVLLEAAQAGCHIVSTDVGSASDITDGGRLGFVCRDSAEFEQDEGSIERQFTEYLQQIIDGKIKLEEKAVQQQEYVRSRFMMSQIVQKGCFRQWAVPERSENPAKV